jgi:hypothetical protein
MLDVLLGGAGGCSCRLKTQHKGLSAKCEFFSTEKFLIFDVKNLDLDTDPEL